MTWRSRRPSRNDLAVSSATEPENPLWGPSMALHSKAKGHGGLLHLQVVQPHWPSMDVPAAGKDVIGCYSEHGKGNLLRRIITVNANGPGCAAVVERARAKNLVCLPEGSIGFLGISGYGEEATAGRRVSVGHEGAEGLSRVPLIVKRAGEVLDTLAGRSEVGWYTGGFVSRRALKIDDNARLCTGFRYHSAILNNLRQIRIMVATYLCVTISDKIRAIWKLGGRLETITLSTATIHTIS